MFKKNYVLKPSMLGLCKIWNNKLNQLGNQYVQEFLTAINRTSMHSLVSRWIGSNLQWNKHAPVQEQNQLSSQSRTSVGFQRQNDYENRRYLKRLGQLNAKMIESSTTTSLTREITEEVGKANQHRMKLLHLGWTQYPCLVAQVRLFNLTQSLQWKHS